MLPIPKNARKSLNDSNNYRSIALSSVLNKVLDKILLCKYKNTFQTSDYQFGYKAHHSTQLCSFLVDEVISKFRSEGSAVYVCLLDASKAFDRLEYTKMFELLSQKNLCLLVLRLLITMYCHQKARGRWGSSISESFPMRNGVKQGGILSPVMFTTYLDVLLRRLSVGHYGCHIGSVFCGAFAYADDITLLSPTLHGLSNMLGICGDFATEYQLLFNASKSRLLVFSDDHRVEMAPLKFMDGNIPVVDSERHLGLVLGRDADDARVRA